MLDSDTKRRIDSARQILVGKVPDPKGQVEQITTALIYKFMDDMDKEAQELGGEAKFFTGEYEKYAWNKLMDVRLGGQARLNLYTEALEMLWQNKNLPVLFQQIFKNAFLPFRDPETLNLFLKEINGFVYDHSERLGDSYEYLLNVLGTQGDAGQFRTPRHIIDFIVAAVDPTKDDTVLDPACGTAGFLISAFKHILKQNTEHKRGDKLTPGEKSSLMHRFTGYDISPDMVRLSLVNMYLHSFPLPNIVEYDTLGQEERWDDSFNVILANPPFMTPKGGVMPHKRFSVQASRSEVLFVDYIAEHLTPNGRAGVIVPEGIIFQSGKAYKQLRKMLVENHLYAVVSLPAGAFNPYSGVKTSVLLMDKHLAKRSTEIAFLKVLHDGFDLGAQRRAHAKDNLPEALEILKAWKVGEKTESPLVTYVEKTKIAETGDYNLSGDRFRAVTDYSNAKWPMVELREVIETITPPKKIQKNDFTSDGAHPIIDQSQQEIAGWTSDESSLVKPNKPLVIFGDHTCVVKYCEKSFAQGADGIKILETNSNLIPKFLYFFLQTNPIKSDGYKRHFSKLVRTKIPLPPLEIQQQIVEELDGYQKIISGARQIVENWKPRIEVEEGWERVKLVDVCEINRQTCDPIALYGEKVFSYLDISSVENGTGQISFSNHIKGTDAPSRARRVVQQCDILLSTVRPNLQAFAFLRDVPPNVIASTGFAVLTPLIGKVDGRFIYHLLFSKPLMNQMLSRMGKGVYPSITQDDVEQLQFPLPPLEVQQQIVEKIETERTLVEAAKTLIGVYEGKMKEAVGRVWGTDASDSSPRKP